MYIMVSKLGLWLMAAALAAVSCSTSVAAQESRAPGLYQEYCASCHHPDRVGRTAPPLVPEYYSRRSVKRLGDIIANGAPATKMPAFSDKLTPDQIDLLVKYIKTPVKDLRWTFDDIRATRRKSPAGSKKEVVGRLEDITLVMERGTRSLVVLKGTQLAELARFHVGNVHGGPKFSHSLKYVYSAARDGLVTKFNLLTLSTEIQFRAGINSRSIAVSGDDRFVAVANHLPSNVVFFGADMEPVHEIAVDGRIGGFYSARAHGKFILSFRDKNEMWIIGDGPPFTVEKFTTPDAFEDFSISPAGSYLLGTKRGSGWLYIYDYKNREVKARFKTRGMPHLASAAFWRWKGELFAGVNHIKNPIATIFSIDRLEKVAEIPLPGAGYFVRTHAATPYLWVDTNTERIALIDKTDFGLRRFLIPRAGRKMIHVEFTSGGEWALITSTGKDGAVIVYDAKTLKKVSSMPFNRPVGKYNAVNKTYPERSLGPKGEMEKVSAAGKGGTVIVSDAKTLGEMEKVSAAGKKVFDNYCMGCHHQVYEAFAPPFRNIAAMRSKSQIRFHIRFPKRSAEMLGYDRNSMPRIKLSSEQLDAVVSYIINFKREE